MSRAFRSVDARAKLNTTAVFITNGDDEIHIAGASGNVVLRARGIRQLHDALLPHLRKGVSIRELLGAVPLKYQEVVSQYIDRLKAARAFERLRTTCHVILLDPIEMGRTLLEIGQKRKVNKSIIYLCCIGTQPAAEAIEAWLRSIGRSQSERGTRVYTLEMQRGLAAVKLLVTLRTTSERLQIPEQLKLITYWGAPQLPLVVLHASHPLFEPGVISVGLRYRDTYEAALLGFIAAAKHQDDSELALARAVESSMPALIADRPIHLHMALWERHALAHIDEHQLTWTSHSIRELWSDNADVQYLINVIRQSAGDNTFEVSHSGSGLFLVRSMEGLLSASFLREKAVRDILLITAACRYYNDPEVIQSARRPRYDFSAFSKESCLRRRGRMYQEYCIQEGQKPVLAKQRWRCWGKTLWRGVVSG